MKEKLLRDYYRTYNSEDADALARFYREEVEFVSALGIQRGREEVLATYRDVTGNFHDKMTPLFISINGDTAVVEIHNRLTAKHDVEDFLGRSFRQGEFFDLRLRGTYHAVDGQFSRIEIEQLADPGATGYSVHA